MESSREAIGERRGAYPPRSQRMGCGTAGRVRRGGGQGGFTLIELMVAVGIIAVIMSIGIPTLYQMKHADSMRKALSDVMEICANARARAILDGTTMELRIRPRDRSFSVGAGSSEDTGGTGAFMAPTGQGGGHSSGEGGGSLSAQLSPSIIIEGLGISGEDWTEDEEARVRFYSNGTCDEMSIVLLSDKGERRNIFLEVVTGMADYEVDPMKFRVR